MPLPARRRHDALGRHPGGAACAGSGERPDYLIVQVEDIGDRKQTERELRLLADHDALTGLLNRRGFMDGLHRELRRMDRRGEYGALLVLDLDNFKLVNDTAGHLAGDEVLRTTAEVLRRRLRATDVIGRLGGDEFAALVLNVTPRQAQRDRRRDRPRRCAALTVTAGDQTIKVAASIGVVAIDEMADDERGRAPRRGRPGDVRGQERAAPGLSAAARGSGRAPRGTRASRGAVPSAEDRQRLVGRDRRRPRRRRRAHRERGGRVGVGGGELVAGDR